MYMSAVKDDVEAQRKGIVEILYQVACKKKINFRLAGLSQRVHGALPIRVAATHVCSDDPTIRLMFEAARPFLNLHRLSRSRIYFGKVDL